jgi:hypothetical protein
MWMTIFLSTVHPQFLKNETGLYFSTILHLEHFLHGVLVSRASEGHLQQHRLRTQNLAVV